MVGPHFIGRDNQGRAFNLAARLAVRDDTNMQQVLLDSPVIVMDVDSAHPKTLTADHGVYDEDTRLLHLNGHVRVDDCDRLDRGHRRGAGGHQGGHRLRRLGAERQSGRWARSMPVAISATEKGQELILERRRSRAAERALRLMVEGAARIGRSMNPWRAAAAGVLAAGRGGLGAGRRRRRSRPPRTARSTSPPTSGTVVNSTCEATWSGAAEALQGNSRLRANVIKAFLKKKPPGAAGARPAAAGNAERLRRDPADRGRRQRLLRHPRPGRPRRPRGLRRRRRPDRHDRQRDRGAGRKNVVRGDKMAIHVSTRAGRWSTRRARAAARRAGCAACSIRTSPARRRRGSGAGALGGAAMADSAPASRTIPNAPGRCSATLGARAVASARPADSFAGGRDLSGLVVDRIGKSFGGRQVVKDVSLRLRARRGGRACWAPTAPARPPAST